MKYLIADTEDDAYEKTGFNKKCTMIVSIDHKGRSFINNGDANDFLCYVSKHSAEKIYFHNLQYDLGNLFGNHLDHLTLTMVGGRIITATWKGKTFVDSFNLFPSSIKALGKAIGLPKLDFDPTNPDYAFRDCEIVARAIDNMLETVREWDIDILPNTMGGLAMRIWREMGGNNWKDGSEFTKSALYGGRTEIFAKGGEGNFAYCDVNSMYPWAMQQLFPIQMEEVDSINSEFGISNVTLEIPKQSLAPLPWRRSDGAILYPCGMVNGTWTHQEIKNAINYHGAKLKKHHGGVGTDSGLRYYHEYIHEMYERRLKAEGAYKHIYKLFMNVGYGQLGMSGKLIKSIPATDEIKAKLRSGEMDGVCYGSNILKTYQMPLPKHVNYSHASYVTSYSRLRLLDYMRKVDPKNLVYCDTDSIIFFWKDKKLPFPLTKNLGEMKLEGWARKVVTHAPKTYEVTRIIPLKTEGKTKFLAKGIPKKKAHRFIRTGSATYDAPFKIREAIQFFDRGNAKKLSVWRPVKKQFRSNYDKKRFDGKRYQPLVLKERETASGAAK